MRVEYTTTADEAGDAIWRWTIQTPAWKRLKRRNALVFAITCMFVGSMWNLREGDAIAVALLIAIALAAALTTLYVLTYNFFARRRVRRYVANLYGPDAFPCAAELRESGVWFTEKHLQGEWKWEALMRIEQSERGIELSFDRGLVMVPTTAFSGEYDQALFVEQVREFSNSRGVAI